MTAPYITSDDPLYPRSFLTLASPPKALWIKGPLPRDDEGIVAIVGTRQASEGGKRMAFEMAKALAEAGIWVISGLARGIDTAAHLGAKGRTLAVVGSGFDHIYPPENEGLARQISLLTEYAPEVRPHKGHFPQRNRLVAALCQAIIVIEAPEKSGALITARLARAMGKRCFVVPGPIDKDNFKGSNRLIKEGKGEICLGIDEVFSLFKKAPPAITPKITHSNSTHPEDFKILSLLEKEDLSFDQLVLLSGLKASHLNARLMNLVLNKTLREYAGKVYGQVANHR